jgi:hypothetical protein
VLAAEWLVNLLLAYSAAGMLFGIVFIASGIGRLDRMARGSGLAFRLIVLPGVVALWPFLLSRWVRGGREQ